MNVWVALAAQRHAHHRAARAWAMRKETAAASLAFCRVTQMGLLRLVTNARVMGPDVLTQPAAWQLYRDFESGAQTRLLAEPPELDRQWESYTQQPGAAQALWTDAYLEAFARLAGANVVTFDRSFAARGRVETVLLG